MYSDYIYEIEDKYLSSYAKKSKDTAGRKVAVTPCTLRTEFARDRDRILHCKSFRRLKHKTQVFLSPEGDHYRTRLTHTLEVSQIARSIACALRLNETLTEAIALGHDLGHTPFGHAGERALNKRMRFEHNEQSKRVVEVLEYDFHGMNLTEEVIDGITEHRKSGNPSTLEGKVVSYADRIAYINHDIDDAIRAGILTKSDIPAEITSVLGSSHGGRINNMILDIVAESYDKPFIRMSGRFERMTEMLRDFMFKTVYTDSAAKAEEGKAVDMLCYLYDYFDTDLSRLPPEYLALECEKEQKICDYISMMTDRYATNYFSGLIIPKGWQRI